MKFSGYPHFLSSCHSPVLPTVSNALLKSTNTIYSGQSCSMQFSCSCRRQNIISTALRLPLKPHCVSGTTSGVLWVDSMLRRILVKIFPAMEKREIPLYFPQSVRSPFLYMVTMLASFHACGTEPTSQALVGAVCWTDWLLRASILQQELHLPQVLCRLSGKRLL